MEIGILLCEDCFFSQRAHAQLIKALSSITGNDRQKLNLKFQSYDFKGIESTKFNRAKIQIIIISQYLIERIKRQLNPKQNTQLNKILRPKRVIAILLNVESEDINSELFNGCDEWHKLNLKSSNKIDPDFYKKFSDYILKIHNIELSNSLSFSVFPKKITKDQPKVIILFKNDLKENDKIHCELTRVKEYHTKEILEVTKNNPFAGMIRMPASLCKDKTSLIEITVFINNEKLGTKLVKYDYNGKHSEEDEITKMILAIPGFRKALDDHISGQLSKNFQSCEDFSLDSSLELMNDILICRGDEFPTVLHFACNFGLEQSVCVILYEGDGLEQSSIKNDSGDTPINIAIEKGFNSIAQNIKEFYEMSTTFESLQYIKDLCLLHNQQLENSTTEAEAEADEETMSANLTKDDDNNESFNMEIQQIENYETEQTNPEYIITTGQLNIVNETSVGSVTIRVESIEMEDDDVRESISSEDSHLSVPVEIIDKSILLQSYDVPPPPVMLKPPSNISNDYDIPRGSMHDYCIPTANLKLKSGNNTITPVLSVKSNIPYSPDGYICMQKEENAQISRPKPPVKPIRAKPPLNLGEGTTSRYPEVNQPLIHFPSSSGLSKKGFLNTGSTSPLPLTKQFSLDPTQEELLELMNDFKKNVYNIRELELLYENWKQRNDVQRDYKIRQKELKEIQKEYQKIQEKIRRENIKKQGPMAKLLKFMPGSRKKNSLGSKTEQNNPSSSSVQPLPPDPPPPPPPNDSDRKISGSSDAATSTISESSSSGPDSGVSDPDSDLKGSYVPPSQIQDIPPVRPPKKPSITTIEPPSLLPKSTPPRTPKISTEKQPIQEELTNIPAKIQSSNSLNPPPPPPPPRVNKPDSPFSYIDYKGKAKGLLGINTGLSVNQSETSQSIIIKSDEKQERSSYENEMDSNIT